MTWHIRVNCRNRLLVLAALVLLPLALEAQQPSATREIFRVYVVDFVQNGPNPHFADLATFTPELIRLQLLQMPMLEVFRTGMRPRCGEESKTSNPGLDTSAQATSNAAARAVPNAPAGRDRSAPTGNFFVISGTVDVRSLDISVDASLDRCQDSQLSPLTTDHALFVPGRALDELNILSQFLAFKLQNSLPAVQVQVAAFTPADRRLADTATALTERLKVEVTQHPGFQLSDKASIVIEGALSRRKDQLDAAVRIRSGGDVKPLEPITGPADNVPKFLSDTSRSVFETMSAVITYGFGSQNYLETTNTNDLIADGKRLLCIEQPAPCRPDASAAVNLLTAAVKKSPNDITATYTLALAQAAALQYSDAVTTLTHVLQLADAAPTAAESRSIKIASLNKLADLSIRRGDLRAAEGYYSRSLEADPNQPDIYVQKAELLFGAKAIEAIRLLLSGLSYSPNATNIHAALQSDAVKLKPSDFEVVADELQSALSRGAPVTEEYAMVCAYAASNLVYSDAVRTQSFLQRIKTLRSEDVSPGTRNWIARLQSIEALEQKNYRDAYQLALNALAILPKDNQTIVLLAQIELAWADELKSQPAKDSERAELLDSAYSRLKPLVEAGDQTAYRTFREVNHLRDADRESVTTFSKLSKSNPDDTAAIENEYVVCNEYLMDLQCAYSISKGLMNGSIDDVGLQLDAVEIAVLLGYYKQADNWLAAAYRHPEADVVDRFVANFYRFWISYVEDDAKTGEYFQALKRSLDDYKHTDVNELRSSWVFDGAKNTLKKSELPAEKKKLLAAIIQAYEDPKGNTSGLSLSSGAE